MNIDSLDTLLEEELLPKGPAVWICGDCHVSNLGPIANANGRIDIQIRDLDQTVISGQSLLAALEVGEKADRYLVWRREGPPTGNFSAVA